MRLGLIAAIALSLGASNVHAQLDLGPDPLRDMAPLDDLVAGGAWASYRALRCSALFGALDRLDLAPSRLDGGPARNAKLLAEEFERSAERAWRLGSPDAETKRSGFFSGIAVIRDGKALMVESYVIRIGSTFIGEGRGPGPDTLVGRDLRHCSRMVGLAD